MKDRFSLASDKYQQYRPVYPAALFTKLASLAPGADLLWDCGCGTGQASVLAAEHFRQVIATDLSLPQVAQARPCANVQYLAGRAEAAPLHSASCDVVLVAQALHWFNFDPFFSEIERVLKPGGLFVALTYNLLSIAPDIDELIRDFYSEAVGKFWDTERRHVENAYVDIPIPWQGPVLDDFAMRARWTPQHLLGYLRTWSAVKNCQRVEGYDPVALIEGDVMRLWPEGERDVRWPLTVIVRYRP
ncbi:class I SAM-dependent methyltransferase [Litorivivens sp.]|uniref:class I SAM-dependent methyltransferase n=1 Tax=Litorivivens sp. TaxID=2020868 RepID=UPI003563F7B7